MSSNASNNREIERESRQRVIREAKRHVYVKGQTRICTTWPRFSFTCHLLFYTQISSWTLLLSIRIVLNCVYLLIFYFEKFSTWIWQLPYAVNVTLNRVIGSLSSNVFERRTSTGSSLFSFFDGGFAQIFSQIASITVKKLRNTNFISSRHVKRENTSLPVDVRRSKTSLLKLPNLESRLRQTANVNLYHVTKFSP